MKVLKKLLEQRDKADKELRKLDAALKLDKPEKQKDGTERTERDPSPEEEQRMVKLLENIEELDKDIAGETKREKRDKRVAEARDFVRAASESPVIQDVKEPMQYGMNSDGENSYFLDLVRYSTGPLVGNLDFGCVERMATWAHQMEREVAHDSKAGKDAMVQLRGMHNIRATANPMEAQRRLAEIRDRGRASLEAKQQEFRERALTERGGQQEIRSGITTGGGATASSAGGGGAAFVVPVFYEGQYAPYREAGRPFADACNQRPLPPYGMTVYLPAVQSAAAVATQSPEGSGITEADPSAGFIAGGLITTAGQVTITQQLLDRAGPNVQYDQIMFDQLRRDYAPKWDKYVITQALASAGAITFTNGSFVFVDQPGNASFVKKVAGAVNTIETTNGTVMSPTDIFLQTSRWNWIESVGALESASGNLHPLLVPAANGPFNAFATQAGGDGFVPYEGNTGYKLFGLPVSKDLNIPVPGTGADQAIVGNLDEVWAFEGPLVPRVVPQTLAPNLAVLLQLYSYGTALVRYPAAVQTISGSGMATVTF